ncbi:MAG TPA: CheR family methyltransferase [Candidatus Sulfotelmatobacter sp.]|jgi:chemotaxis protein methyltransferase CheR
MGSFGHAELDHFRAIIAGRLGLQFDNGRSDRLAEVLRLRLDAQGAGNAAAYLTSIISSANGREELRALAAHLTVSETYFFRCPDHFRALQEVALPSRIRARNSHRRLRLLSAGCASGEEAYSLAILLREHFSEVAGWDLSIVGIDLNPTMLAKANAARYSSWSLRETADPMRNRCFRREGGDFLLDERFRRMVSFEERNLAVEGASDWAMEQFDIIFCRNVMMYLVPDAVRVVVARLTQALAPAGFLFLSHAETLRGLSRDFHLRHTHDTFYYQKREGTNAIPEPPQALAPNPQLPIASLDISWVDAIRVASERINNLSQNSSRHVEANPSPARFEKGAGQRGTAQFGFVLELLRQERFQAALEAFNGLPSAATADGDAQLLRAVLLSNCGDVSAALTVCEQILSLDDLNAGAHYVVALCREHAGDYAGAIEHDRAAIYLDPAFAMPHLHLGLLAKRRGDLAISRRELEQARTLLPGEDASRLLLLGGGFGRETLMEFSRAQLFACGGTP